MRHSQCLSMRSGFGRSRLAAMRLEPVRFWAYYPIDPIGAGMTDRPTEFPGSMDPSMPATIIRERPAAAAAPAETGAPPGSGDLTEELLNSDQWTDAMVQAAGIPVADVPFVTVGGGIGSFVTVDYLRIAGVP